MKVLILADVCNPNWPSLPGFSYSLAESIAQNVDVVLVTHIRNKKDISNKASNFKEIIYINNEYIASPLYKFSNFLRKIGIGGFMTGMALKYPSNIAFEYEVYKLLKMRRNNKEFDLIHRISPVSPTIPSPIAKWANNTPFIYGPLNGGLPWPTQYRDEIKKERELLVHVRNLYKFLPYYKSSFSHASKILAAFSHVEKDIPKLDHSKIVRFNELGVDTDLYKPGAKIENNSNICQFLFVGRLVPYKCPHVVISAFIKSAELRNTHKLNIVGDGPERASLQQLIDQHHLNDCVKILGWKNQQEVAQYMAESDVFVFPTIREVGGNVLLEAMSAGLPSIVPNYGGPSELINDDIGIRIPLATKDVFLQAYIESMELLAIDIELREKLANNARVAAVEIHSWPMKGIQMKNIYESALATS